jgi:hypothetical protein
LFAILVSASLSAPIYDYSNVITTYENGLFSYSSKFVRPNRNRSDYYYHAIRVRIFTRGSYSFTSSSLIDTYGSFHHFAVDPTNPYESLITFDDDSGGGRQFRISLDLQSEKTYILLVTTFAPNVTGWFKITAVGPASVNLTYNHFFIILLTAATSK